MTPEEILVAIAKNLSNYEWVKRSSFIRPIAKNKVDESKYPCIIKEDIAFTAYIHCTQDFSTPVEFQHLEMWGVDKYTLFRDIIDIAMVNRPITFKSFAEEARQEIREDEFIYICSAGSLVPYGASVLMYPDFVDKARMQMGGDFFILPMSAHNLLLMREDKAPSIAEMSQCVCGANHIQTEDNVLTDSVYFCGTYGVHRIA